MFFIIIVLKISKPASKYFIDTKKSKSAVKNKSSVDNTETKDFMTWKILENTQ